MEYILFLTNIFWMAPMRAHPHQVFFSFPEFQVGFSCVGRKLHLAPDPMVIAG
jgi:hypothetical protein